MLQPHTLYKNNDDETLLLVLDDAIETLPMVDVAGEPEVMLYPCINEEGRILATQGTIESKYTALTPPVPIQKQFTVSMTNQVPKDQVEQMIAQVQAACIHITSSQCVPFEITFSEENVKDELTPLGGESTIGYWSYGTVEQVNQDDQYIHIDIVLAGFLFTDKLNPILSKHSEQYNPDEVEDYATVLDRMITRFHNPMAGQIAFGRFLDFDVMLPSDDALDTTPQVSDVTETELPTDFLDAVDFDSAEELVKERVEAADEASAVDADNDCGDACKL